MNNNVQFESTKFNINSNKMYEVLTNLIENMLNYDNIIKKYIEFISIIHYSNTNNIKNNNKKCIIDYTNNTIKQLLVQVNEMIKVYNVSKLFVSNIENIIEYYMYDKFDNSNLYIYNESDLLVYINKFRTNNNLKCLLTLKNNISNIKYLKINNKMVCLVNGNDLNTYLNSIYKNFKNVIISNIYILNLVNEIYINNEKIIKIKRESDNILNHLEIFINNNKVTNNNINYKSTSLINAIKNKHDICIKFLIESNSNSNISQRDEFDFTALMVACQNGHLKSVKLLLDHGANINDSNKYGTPLIFASKNGHYDIVRYLIEKHANINDTDINGNTALMYACLNNNYDIVRYLINNCAHINKYNNDGNNSLIFSCNRGRYNIVKLLIEKGAYINDINDINKISIFNINCKKNINLNIVELLLEKSINNKQFNEMISIIITNRNKFNMNQSVKINDILTKYNIWENKNLKRKKEDIILEEKQICSSNKRTKFI
jgi:ankyrin repeat protein